jgi:hypothetical protein
MLKFAAINLLVVSIISVSAELSSVFAAGSAADTAGCNAGVVSRCSSYTCDYTSPQSSVR